MKSIWEDVKMPVFPQLSGDTKTDVLIIGGGMAGLLCARFLRDAGVSCIVAEAGRIAGGITAGTTAKVTSQHGLIYQQLVNRFGLSRAEQYLWANEAAVSDFRRLCQGLACDWEDQDSFVYSCNDRSILDTELDVLQSMSFPAKFAEGLPLPFSTVGAVVFPNQGQFHPLKLLAGITGDLPIYEHTKVLELVPGYAVTDHGRIYADKIIAATHFPFLNKHGSYFLKLYQQRSYVLAVETESGITGMYLDAQKNGLSFRSAGNALLLGGGGHRTGSAGGGWQELEAQARKFYPHAGILRRWAAQDCMSLDGVPYIGQYSKHTPNLFVATGFNKWGMTSSMAAARILTDLVQGKNAPYAEVFSPSRSMLHWQLGLNALQATKNLLTPTKPRCPHLGCALKWNPQEHSWDCPCHGSRFSKDGKCLDNPQWGTCQNIPRLLKKEPFCGKIGKRLPGGKHL